GGAGAQLGDGVARDRGGFEGLFDLARRCGVELAVDVGHQGVFVELRHPPQLQCTTLPWSSSLTPSVNRATASRARASRLITVPIGSPRVSAVSRYDNPSTHTRSSTSRCASGSFATARRTVSS